MTKRYLSIKCHIAKNLLRFCVIGHIIGHCSNVLLFDIAINNMFELQTKTTRNTGISVMYIVTSLLESAIYCLLLCFYYPLYLFGMFMIKVKLIWNQFKSKTGWYFIYQGVMKPLSKKSKVRKPSVGLLRAVSGVHK